MQGSFLGLNYLWGDAPQLSELAHEVGSAGYGVGIFIGRMPYKRMNLFVSLCCAAVSSGREGRRPTTECGLHKASESKL